MSSSCRSAFDCIDTRAAPVRATYVNLYRWPESDAEFVRSVTRRRDGMMSTGMGTGRAAPAVVDSYSCRQMYLRSYTFSKKETVPQKTMRCLSTVKEKAVELPFILQRSHSVSSSKRNHETESYKGEDYDNRMNSKKKKKKKKRNKRCLAVRKLVSSLFHRLLACTSRVDVVDGLYSAGRDQ